MKKAISLILAAALLLSLTACSGKQSGGDTSQEKTQDASVSTGGGFQEENSSEYNNSDDGINVDSGFLNVTITVPASFLGEDFSQEDVEQAVQEGGYKSGTLNEDGSVTYVMSKSKHQELMSRIRESIDSSLAEMAGSESYPDIVSVTANDNYTQYIVKLSADEVSIEMSFLPLEFYIFSGMYHAFNGTEAENINIQFMNEAGDILEESNSSDLESQD